jgi:nucleotide-binding universal stress UspA family protein
VRATGLIMEGSPYEVIARAARSRRADVLVLGTHGRTGLSRFFLGSVAARVLASAPCPVLTVRGR